MPSASLTARVNAVTLGSDVVVSRGISSPSAPVLTTPGAPTGRALWLGARLVRAAWLAAATLGLGLYALTIPAAFVRLADPTDPLRAELDPTIDPSVYAVTMLLITGTAAVAFFAIGLMIARRRFEDPMALVCSALVLAGGGTLFSLDLSRLHPTLGVLGQTREYLTLVLLVAFGALFPDGDFVPRWMRWAVLGAAVLGLASFLGDSPLNWTHWRGLLGLIPGLLLLVALVGAQAYRYARISGQRARQQQKWVVAGFVAWLLVTIAMPVLPTVLPPAPARGSATDLLLQAVLNGAAVLAPLGLAIAVLRHRLWDIDVLLNRALVYGVLTGLVVGAYGALVGGLGLLLGVGTTGNLALSLGATGLIAVLFQPARAQLQTWANRLLYGERDDPYGVLVRLGHRLEGTLAPEAVLPTVVHTVAEALRLPFAAIVLRDRDGADLQVAAAGQPLSDTVRVPLVYQGENVGLLLLGPRAPGESFGRADRELLDNVARQAGVAAHAVRLNADLQRARERLVTAREEERRRLRRDLHDGLGSHLVGLSLQLGGLRSLIQREPLAAAAQVTELQAELRGAVATVRQLVQDLRPPALDELGLVAALRQLGDRLGSSGAVAAALGGSACGAAPRITIDASDALPPLPAAVEVALYRITQEALTNALKHSQARGCSVVLAMGASGVELAIADDGIGMPSGWTPGVGLQSMRERAEELGGSLRVVSEPAAGTRVLVRLPLAATHARMSGQGRLLGDAPAAGELAP